MSQVKVQNSHSLKEIQILCAENFTNQYCNAQMILIINFTVLTLIKINKKQKEKIMKIVERYINSWL